MKKSLGFYILMALTWPMQLFPLEFHYIFSNLLYVIVYKSFAYRKSVVKENLKNSFPEKTPEELAQIISDFYLGFTDMFIETLYLTHINMKKEARRLKVINLEYVESLHAQGKSVIAVTGHFGNWEFMQLFKGNPAVNTFFVYKKLNSSTFDQYYRYLRSRAAFPLEMKETYRKLMSDAKENNKFLAFFISDQRPIPEGIKHWVNFLNQDTPVMLGTEKIAKKINAAVVYTEVKRVKRGYYQVTFEQLIDDSSHTEPFEITNLFMKRLEQSINENPDQYFWTHKRWKHKRKTNE